MLIVVASDNLRRYETDVKTVFKNVDLSEVIYIELPKNFVSQKVLHTSVN